MLETLLWLMVFHVFEVRDVFIFLEHAGNLLWLMLFHDFGIG